MDHVIQNRDTPRNILQIRQGLQETTLCAKHQGKYGTNIINNVGVFRWSEISAILFTIYLGDIMEDYNEINPKEKLPTRKTLQGTQSTGEKALLQQLQTKQTHKNNKYK